MFKSTGKIWAHLLGFIPFPICLVIASSSRINKHKIVRLWTVKVQISQQSCTIWSWSLLYVNIFLSIQWFCRRTGGPDQTARMPRLIWFFAGHIWPEEQIFIIWSGSLLCINIFFIIQGFCKRTAVFRMFFAVHMYPKTSFVMTRLKNNMEIGLA